uniref:Uncharacterized protein n=1 Tax=Heterorhabditis bacteriophora TaxID=37862 RepID=A0A1I7X9K9_HETBA
MTISSRCTKPMPQCHSCSVHEDFLFVNTDYLVVLYYFSIDKWTEENSKTDGTLGQVKLPSAPNASDYDC